jgi:diacylglycerol kinase family enzyme
VLRGSEATTAMVKLDEREEKRPTVANLCIANARYFGGGMKVAPEAKLDDGLFEVVSIGNLGTMKILTNAPRRYLGTYLGMQNVNHALARRLEARPVAQSEKLR